MIKKILKFVIEKRKLIFGAIIFCVVLSVLTFSNYGFLKRYETARENKTLENRIKTERAEQDSLRLLIEKLKYDRSEIERIAREHYGMIKPGEKVFIVPQKNAVEKDEK